jgi:hypothetical protein
MRRNGILIALACITFLAGISAAVELYGGNDVQFSDGTGGASGGPWVWENSGSTYNYLELGVYAQAWADEDGKGNGSAAFTGSGSVTNFQNLADPEDGRGFIQSVNYTGRVQAKVSKTSEEGEAYAVAEVYADTYASKYDADAEYVDGNAGLYTSIGHGFMTGDQEFMTADGYGGFNGMGTATAVASGSAGYDAQYINKSDKTGRSTSIKISGSSLGDAYMTAENKKFLGEGEGTNGEASMRTYSNAQNGSGSYSDSSIDIGVDASNGADKGPSSISGYVNDIKSESYAWDTNRTGKPDSTNYNVYTRATGNLSAEAKTFEKGDAVEVSSYESSTATHFDTAIIAGSEMSSDVAAWRKINNNAHRVEGETFIDNGYTIGVVQGHLGNKLAAAESNIRTLNGGDNVGAGIFLSNKTSEFGFNASTEYSQAADWNNTAKRFELKTNFKQDNFGLNFTATNDTGAMGVRMNILSTGKKLNALYGAGSNWTEYYTDIPQQKSWNWYGAKIGTLNHGETFSKETFKPSGQETVNSTTYVQRHFTRELDTSNPF